MVTAVGGGNKEDGTLAFSVKISRSYHLPGPVTSCSDGTLKKFIDITMPIVRDAAGLGKVFIPPTATVCVRCLLQQSGSLHQHQVRELCIRHLTKADHLRSLLKTEFGRQSITRHWVLEGWKDLLGVRGASRRDDLNSLSQVSVPTAFTKRETGMKISPTP
jgi:hypothetical protein